MVGVQLIVWSGDSTRWIHLPDVGDYPEKRRKMPRSFYYSPTHLKCKTCGKPAGYVIKSGGETYNYACNETHAKAQVKELKRAWQ